MSKENVSVSTTVDAPAETVFAVLTDPATHEAIDGTGWVRQSVDGKPLTEVGQIFRMGMYHDNHPDEALRDGEPGRGVRQAARHRLASPARDRTTAAI